MGAMMPPPMLWPQFQMAILVPRSLTENQWVMVRPAGGQPMPCTQPLANMSRNMIQSAEA